jgi:hypothetical protein
MAANRGRRSAVLVLVLLLSLPLLALALPGSPVTMRVAGVTLLWWYATVAAPLAAAISVVVTRATR